MKFGFKQTKDKKRPPVSLVFLDRLKRISDGHFALRFKAGEPEAFEWVFGRFRKPILRYVIRRVRDQHTAEEITQEVFLKAFRFRDSYDPKFAFSTWIWTIARNAISDWYRKKGTAPVAVQSNDSEPFDVESVPCTVPNAEAALIGGGERAILVKLMHDLTDLQKEALLMRLVHQLPYQQIAHQLDLSLSSVKCLVYRAKGSLVKKLELLAEAGHLEDQVRFDGLLLKV